MKYKPNHACPAIIFSALALLLAGCGGGTPQVTLAPPGESAPPSEKLNVVSHLNIAAGPEHIADIKALTAANGLTYAYLGSFDRPSCSPDITGVHIVDITAPRTPEKTGFIPSPAGTKVNDVKVARLATTSFRGDVLVHTAELCQGTSAATPDSIPGIVLYDVTDPMAPRRLAPEFSLGFEVHNSFVFQIGERAFVAVVEDDSPQDFHILEITDPATPVEIAVRGWQDWLDPGGQMRLGSIPLPLLHDVFVTRYASDPANRRYSGKTIAYLNYWDAGLILLDISDPANPVFLGDSDYLNPDPVSGRPPEGNSHSAMPTFDGQLVFMADEDSSPSAVAFTVESGPGAGTYRAVQADPSFPLSELKEGLSGGTVFTGPACSAETVPPAPAAGEEARSVAFIESGGCSLTRKLASVEAAGYQGAILNSASGPPQDAEPELNCDPPRNIPALLVGDPATLAIMGQAPPEQPQDAQPPLPAPGTPGAFISAQAVFDGWGYARILDVSNPAAIRELSQFATPNVTDPLAPPGNLTIHNVVVKERRAYISWYAEGIRVVDFMDPMNPREVAFFVDEELCSDFWGVFVLEHPDGQTYILGSDRSTGLWIFESPPQPVTEAPPIR